MDRFGEKLRGARASLGISQSLLAEAAGVSTRSIAAYESGEKRPRQGTLMQLARALHISSRYLTDDECDDPLASIERDGYFMATQEAYGTGAARDISALMAENAAFFAGGSVPQEEKDAFFEALMKTYITCKEEARHKYGKKGE